MEKGPKVWENKINCFPGKETSTIYHIGIDTVPDSRYAGAIGAALSK